MNKQKAKKAGLKRRQRRVRSKIFGTAQRPRLNVRRTNANIYAQLVDDTTGTTLVSASTLDPKFRELGKVGSNKDAAEFVGKLIGERAVEAGHETVVFDRGGNIYHGRIKALADGARSAGLKF